MRNRIKMAAVAVTAAAVLAGCGQVPQGQVTEPAPPAAVEPVETTAPAETRYQFGDIVWVLDQRPDGAADTIRFAVVAHEGDVVMVTHAVSDSPEALRKCLPEYIESGDGEVWAIDAAECFPSEEDAFEEYWGCE